MLEELRSLSAIHRTWRLVAEKIAFASARDGQLATLQDEGFIDYEALDPNDTWVFLPDRERAILDRLNRDFPSLERCEFVESIFVGIQTSADLLYHLERMSKNSYRQIGSGADGATHAIEDQIMRPLISGSDAKRYQNPKASKHLLFPYDISGQTPRLWSEDNMKAQFPLAWEYFKKYEKQLRERENKKMDDDSCWWAYNYPKNLDKQHLPKLGVAQTVPEMRVFFDSAGEFCLNNVRVNGILVDDAYTWFVLGILNSRVCDFVFRRISKPKEPRPSGAYFEANKQYIAPLPIPMVTDPQRDRVTELAKQLQTLHTQRRDTIESIDKRIASSQMTPDPKEPNWIWADVHDVTHWKTVNPKQLAGRALGSWSKEHYESLLADKIASMDDQMAFGQTMLATFDDGQLKFFVGDVCVLDGIYVTDDDAKVILPQWQSKLRDTFVSESMDAKRVLTSLLDLRKTAIVELIRQLHELTKQLYLLEKNILSIERTLDDFVHDLYALTPDERKIIESDTAIRSNARIPRVTL